MLHECDTARVCCEDATLVGYAGATGLSLDEIQRLAVDLS